MVRLFIMFLCILSMANLTAAEWQWSVEIKSMQSDETKDHPRAFLWIPSDCKQIRGIVVGMHNMQEEGILEHPLFRKVMSELGFAEIWVTPGISPLFDPSKGAQIAFDEMLKSLAEVSGYTEIEYSPIVPIGHSAYASYPWNFAALNPAKTLAVLSVHGDAPQTNLTGCGLPNLIWGERSINGIPGLMVMGEEEWWDDRLTPALDYKNNNPQSTVSLLADAGHGHFDHSDMLIDYLAMFVRKAAEYRLPPSTAIDHQAQMKPVNPVNGWLAERWYKDKTPDFKADSFSLYKGDKANAFWYFDKEMAAETEKYYAKARAKKPQYIGISQKGKLLPFDEKSHERFKVKFEPDDDGLTFHLRAVFTDSTRSILSELHSNEKHISIDRICGPVQKINDSTFTVRFYRMGFESLKRTGDIWLIAHHEGDDIYKSAVQQLNIRIPFRNTEGKDQEITFAPIENVNSSIHRIIPDASSDSGLPVYFYIKEGPAEVVDNEIVLTQIPPRAKYPVKVTVVAWQYGLNGKINIRTAMPKEQTFYVDK